MKKSGILVIGGLILIFAAALLHADGEAPLPGYGGQPGHTGQPGFAGQPGFMGQPGFTGQQAGSMGPSFHVSVAQLAFTFPNKAYAVMRGHIIQHLGRDRYLFRDSTGDVVIKIKHNRWWGLSVGPNDLVEIGGQLKREKNGWIKYFDAKTIRMAY